MVDEEPIEEIRDNLNFRLVMHRHLDRVAKASIDINPLVLSRGVRLLYTYAYPYMDKEENKTTLKTIKKIQDKREPIKFALLDPNVNSDDVGILTKKHGDLTFKILEILMIFLDKKGVLLESESEDEA